MSSTCNQLTVSAKKFDSGCGQISKHFPGARTVRANSVEPDSICSASKNLSSSLTVCGSPKIGSSPRLMRRTPTIDTCTIAKEEYEGHTRVNQYKVLDIIGHGAYGIVRKATDDNDEVYAMKILNKKKLIRKGGFAGRVRPGLKPRSTPWDHIEREIAILKKLDHPNVVRLFEVLDDRHENELILVFEYIHKGPVVDKLPMEEPFSEAQSRDYFVDIVLGLEYLHSQHIIHRDIKPQNLLLDDSGNIKIADFGVSEQLERSGADLSQWAGTPAFLAPETLVSSSVFKGQGVDIWATGVTLFCFIFGMVPWSPPSIPELYEMIKNDEVPMPPDQPVSVEFQDILMKLLTKDPEKRITISELRAHPWVLKTSRPIPASLDNCSMINVSDKEIEQAIKPFYTPLHILIMIKNMAMRRSLRNPRLSSESSSPALSPIPSQRSCIEDEEVPKASAKITQERREKFALSNCTPSILVDDSNGNTSTPQDSS